MAKYAITTIDNPYDPFEQFDAWYMFDMDKGYNTCSYLDRIARTSSQLSDEENDKEIERAINEIIKYDFRNIYRKVKMKETIT
jgi:hypothetical protein